MTQREIVLKHIEEYGHITSWEAMQEYGINQLHPIIADLRKAGIPIKREMVSQKNRYGDGYCVDPDRFVDFYTSNGWRVGKNPMKDWKAAVRSWERKEKPNGKTESKPLWNVGTVV